MRVTCGRLNRDYRYSEKIIYPFFHGLIPPRSNGPELNRRPKLSWTHGPCTPELRKAHQDNDRAVMRAYGFDVRTMTESSCVAELMRLYQKLTGA